MDSDGHEPIIYDPRILTSAGFYVLRGDATLAEIQRPQRILSDLQCNFMNERPNDYHSFPRYGQMEVKLGHNSVRKLTEHAASRKKLSHYSSSGGVFHSSEFIALARDSFDDAVNEAAIIHALRSDYYHNVPRLKTHSLPTVLGVEGNIGVYKKEPGEVDLDHPDALSSGSRDRRAGDRYRAEVDNLRHAFMRDMIPIVMRLNQLDLEYRDWNSRNLRVGGTLGDRYFKLVDFEASADDTGTKIGLSWGKMSNAEVVGYTLDKFNRVMEQRFGRL